MDEEWRVIPSCPNYEASNLGQIRNSKTGRVLKQMFDGEYYKVGIVKNGKHARLRVHRLILEAFIPNTERKQTVNHRDGDKSNNKIENLEWATYREQAIHVRDVLFENCCEKHRKSRYTNDEVREMRRQFNNSEKTIRELADENRDAYCNIWKIVNHKRWKALKN